MRINTYIYQTSIPGVGFKPTIPAAERAKTVRALRCVHITRARAGARQACARRETRLVLVNLRPHYFSFSPGFGAWGSLYLLVVCIGCSTSTSNVDGPLDCSATDHEDIWRGCIDTHRFNLELDGGGQLHAPTALSAGKEPSVSVG
jgi:hypothetical protein